MARLPNLLIIGSAKCGTSSLHYYLGLHPEIMMSRTKELAYFVKTQNWYRGIEWYKSQFQGEARIFGESTPGYTFFPGIMGVPERIYKIIPDVKLIYIIRDPIERIISSYMTRYASGRENRSIEKALDNLSNNSLIYPSNYYFQLQQYLIYFKKSSIHVLTLDSLQSNRRETLRSVFSFLGVDKAFYSEKYSIVKNPSNTKRRKNRIGMMLRHLSETPFINKFPLEFRRNVGNVLYRPFSRKIQRPVLSEKLMERLVDYFRSDVKRIKEFADLDLTGWTDYC